MNLLVGARDQNIIGCNPVKMSANRAYNVQKCDDNGCVCFFLNHYSFYYYRADMGGTKLSQN